MMFRMALFLVTAMAALAAEDSWAKVRQLKSGADVRIYTRGATQPLSGEMDEVREEWLIVVIKNKQVAIAKDRIDRIDARPIQSGARVTKEKTESVKNDATGQSSSTSSGLTFHPRPNFETIYTHKR